MSNSTNEADHYSTLIIQLYVEDPNETSEKAPGRRDAAPWRSGKPEASTPFKVHGGPKLPTGAMRQVGSV
jgi:hypothetical protein